MKPLLLIKSKNVSASAISYTRKGTQVKSPIMKNKGGYLNPLAMDNVNVMCPGSISFSGVLVEALQKRILLSAQNFLTQELLRIAEDVLQDQECPRYENGR
ncbi:MAG: hypothetical protein EZS28_046067 [Streblomastix strix]|uniref:Uncharacterized protein n=1 Tax=Streblomastix strix TaxID=222440 RepID=A0A5J4TJF7_9EUKA|nr:MAG: hypothetical protein EZS28_046067 [Streblomastix strix]